MSSDLLYQLALTLIPNIGPVQAKILLQHFDVTEIFRAKKHQLEKIEGIGAFKAAAIKSFKDFTLAEEEIRFMEKYQIQPLFITHPRYPKRLLNCYDSPTMVYFKGDADLNASKVVAVIGTRSHTDYGKMLTDQLITVLKEYDVTVISGLAHGIDAIAHKSAIRNQLPTVGVLAHGLDQLYPFQHKTLAKDMLHANGGLLTEFRRQTKPDKHNFPTRNRVVAGMSDATVVVETGRKGGSMITAELANNYNRDVFAFPGRTTDIKSAGCNYLVKTNKAVLLTEPADLAELMGWQQTQTDRSRNRQKDLFIELTDDERLVVKLLQEKDSMHIDEINLRTGLSSSAVAAAILSLELQNVVLSLPGKLYQVT
jgi:DNA processing protein